MGHEVHVGRREAALVISKRFPVRLSEIGGALGRSFGEVYGHLGAHGVETQGPPFVIYHEVPAGDEPFDVEVCAPIGRPAEAPPGWELQELPAGRFATLMHVGPYDSIGATYEELTTWLGAHDMAVAGPPREVYLSEPSTPPAETRTIIEFPVSETPALVHTT